MVELAEARVMNKKMLKKLKRHHHGHRHGQDHSHNGDEVLHGTMAPNGNEVVIVLRGKHYHHHHHHHHCHGPDLSGLEAKCHEGEENINLHSKETKHHRRRGRHGRPIVHKVIEGTIRGLKHHVKRHQHIYEQYCRGLGLDFLYHNQPQDGSKPTVDGAPVTPSAPEAELMMKNLSIAEDKEANKA